MKKLILSPGFIFGCVIGAALIENVTATVLFLMIFFLSYREETK